MKLLLVVPGLLPPWTEGRKNFIRDLIPVLQDKVELRILSTATGLTPQSLPFSVPVNYASAKTKSLELISLHKAVKRHLTFSDGPDIVIHFPYGTFSGVRGVINKLGIIAAHRMVTKAGLPCLTVLYSMTHGDLLKLSNQVPTLATAESHNWSGHIINVGLDLKRLDPLSCPENNKRIIFMAGYHENKSSLLKNILYERGLIDIIQIGEQLAMEGFHLSVVAPLLKHPQRLAELKSLLRKISPSLPVTFFTQVNIQDLFGRHSMYIFPQRKNYNVFIPTSVLEAMAVGIPVIMPDLPMLNPLIGREDGFCWKYRARNPESLLQAVLDATLNWEETCRRALRGRLHVRQNWTIEHSARQLMEIVMELVE